MIKYQSRMAWLSSNVSGTASRESDFSSRKRLHEMTVSIADDNEKSKNIFFITVDY